MTYDYLRDKIIRRDSDLCQELAKALHFPMYKDDPEIFPNATEADGYFIGEDVLDTMVIRACNRIRELEEKCK